MRPFHIAIAKTKQPNNIKYIVVSGVLSTTSNFSLNHAGKKIVNGKEINTKNANNK